LAVKSKNLKGYSLKIVLIVAFLYVGVQAIIQSGRTAEREEERKSFGTLLLESVADGMEDLLYNQFLPGAVLAEEQRGGTNWLVQEQIDSLTPLYGYFAADISAVCDVEQQEGEEILTELLMAENEAALLPEKPVEESEIPKQVEEQAESVNTVVGQFVPHRQLVQVDLVSLGDYETLLKEFYTVDANTSASSERLNVESFLQKDMTVSKEDEGPQILIFHTHSQEGFADSVPGDESTTIIGVGERLKQVLEETYGYQVLHHMGKYDVESRNDAYSEALPEIEQLLEENPTIQVVIDLHRDSMPEGTKLVMDLDGKPTARFMFFNGLSRTKTTGNISYLHNENLDENLAFSFQMQLKAAEYYPGLTRKIYLKGYRYNMHLKDKFLLVELGAQNNTVEEAMNACDPLAHILDLVLSPEGSGAG